MTRHPQPGSGGPDGMPTPYANMPPLAFCEVRWLRATVMDDGKIGIGITGTSQQTGKHIWLSWVPVSREDFDAWLTGMVAWWEREKAEPLAQVYNQAFDDLISNVLLAEGEEPLQ